MTPEEKAEKWVADSSAYSGISFSYKFCCRFSGDEIIIFSFGNEANEYYQECFSVNTDNLELPTAQYKRQYVNIPPPETKGEKNE